MGGRGARLREVRGDEGTHLRLDYKSRVRLGASGETEEAQKGTAGAVGGCLYVTHLSWVLSCACVRTSSRRVCVWEASAARERAPPVLRGLHPSTSQLNLSHV
jgi:hypothetical protein